jgi:cohesin complex subunit SA-1/2
MGEEDQYRCAGFLQAEIERYTELLQDRMPVSDDEEEHSSGDEDTDAAANKKSAKTTKNSKRKRDVILSQFQLCFS